MNKSLYNKYQAFTPEAYELADSVDRAVKPLFDKYAAEGYSYREIGHIIQAMVSSYESECVIRAAMEKRRKEREEKGQL